MNAIITGATKGIGQAIAIQLAQLGYNLILCARNNDELFNLKEELKSYPIEVLTLRADCSIKQEVLNFFEKAIAFAPQIDVLVNNVGVFQPAVLIEEDDLNFEYQIQLNLFSTYYLGKRVGNLMKKQGFGHIFNICSVASKNIIENAGSYSVTKAAMLSLNDVLRMELTPHHVKVTALIPGSTYTASWEGTNLDKESFVQPKDIAKAVKTILELSKGANIEELIIKPMHL